MKLNVYTQDAKKKGTVELSDAVFATTFRPALIKQVILAILANRRTPVAHTKGRGDVRGGGKKPWKQKGTGRARHGSTRSPIWIGGGVTHGPLNTKNYTKKTTKKMRRIALASALSVKVKDNEILALEDLKFEEPKTKFAKEVLTTLSSLEGFEKMAYKKKNNALIVLPEKSEVVMKSFANFGNVFVKKAVDLNVHDVFKYKFVVLVNPEQVNTILEERLSGVKSESSKSVSDKGAKKETKKAETKADRPSKSEKDDLTKIEGIGPVIAKRLAENGISTFADLAKAKTEDVQTMIDDIRGNHDAGTWGKQAELARDGKWDELKAWQDELIGGK